MLNPFPAGVRACSAESPDGHLTVDGTRQVFASTLLAVHQRRARLATTFWLNIIYAILRLGASAVAARSSARRPWTPVPLNAIFRATVPIALTLLGEIRACITAVFACVRHTA